MANPWRTNSALFTRRRSALDSDRSPIVMKIKEAQSIANQIDSGAQPSMGA
jgi:hypothetical protein